MSAPVPEPEPPELTVGPITRTDIVRFAGAGGDFNPLHHDEEYARAAGFPSVFAMGQMQAGMLSRLATDWLGLAAIESYKVRFAAKVWPGDVLTLRVAEQERDGDAVEAVLEAVRQDGEVAVRAWVRAKGMNDR
ncbi:MAG TPA: MaoC/PaaZ C-terminal domain-containing protein [Baekduia sp.]|uniref:MaoC/PaaZ C-terminal domain-containing protein n=1 Tax=Baekduia sp. TaxID=2600305 RepID=UPI002D783B7F|nr:MaoC/PaaZ C-terminal domain-containing protein [Baekduia sp.]HET6507913.1 MaoC/PaaZ C-terminal domain-containing protein [Baekduia sp.]